MDKLLAAHVKEPPPRFAKIGCGHVPPAVEAVVQLALSKYPNERQQSARELAEDVRPGARRGLLGGDRAGRAGSRRRRPTASRRRRRRRSPDPPADPFHVTHEFEAFMPERLAAAKLRGFVEDLGGRGAGERAGADPDAARRAGRAQTAPPSSGIFGWLPGRRARPTVARGQEPIEVELHMEKPDPSQSAAAASSSRSAR